MAKDNPTGLRPRTEPVTPAYPGNEPAWSERTRREFIKEAAAVATVLGVSVPMSAALADDDVTETKVLILDRGYVIRLVWTRPPQAQEPAAVLEAMIPTLYGYLAQHASKRVLHNPGRLEQLEGELVGLLKPSVVPAVISKLSLEHDCAQVCGKQPSPTRRGKRAPVRPRKDAE